MHSAFYCSSSPRATMRRRESIMLPGGTAASYGRSLRGQRSVFRGAEEANALRRIIAVVVLFLVRIGDSGSAK